jgi:hypothetical protein
MAILPYGLVGMPTDNRCTAERPNAAFRIQASWRPSSGRSWRPTRLVRV